MSEYVKLNYDELKSKISQLITLWSNFIETAYTSYSKCKDQSSCADESLVLEELYDVNLFSLREVFERTHQREDYFVRYHNKLIMSDFKEIGLIAFWICKFKPFHLKEKYFSDEFSMRINEEFALFFIFNSLSDFIKEKKLNYKLSRIDYDLYNELLYTMQYRDVSKEAYGCIVELIYLAMINN